MISQNYKYFLLTGIRVETKIKELPFKKFKIKKYPILFSTSNLILIPTLENDSDQFENPILSRGMIGLEMSKPISMIKAKEYLHCLEASFLIYFFCKEKDFSDEWTILPLSKPISFPDLPVTYSKLLRKYRKEINYGYPTINYFKNFFHTYTIESQQNLNDIIKIFSYSLEHQKLYNASSFLCRSIKELNDDTCDWKESNYDENYDEYTSIGNRESSFLNSYKAIEAILGDLGGKSNRKNKIIDSLMEEKLDPNKNMGIIKKETLTDQLLKFSDIRDEFAAHGSTNKQQIKYKDLFQIQILARILVLNRIQIK